MVPRCDHFDEDPAVLPVGVLTVDAATRIIDRCYDRL